MSVPTAISNLFDIKGKTAIVTGGAGILGQHLCRALAENGASVAVIDTVSSGVELAKSLSDTFRTRCDFYHCDIASSKEVADTVQRISADFSGIDILVNNAATKTENLEDFFRSTEEYELETWRKVMAVNLDGMFLMSQAVGNEMIRYGKGGGILQVSSIYGVVAPDPGLYEGSFYLDRPINTPAVYSASKAGVIGLTRYLSTAWAKHGIRVNAIVPGGIGSGQNSTFQEKYAQKVPLGRMAKPEEMLGGMLYLVSPASSYVTGQTLAIDGGFTAW